MLEFASRGVDCYVLVFLFPPDW